MRQEELQHIFQDLKTEHHKLTSGTKVERMLAELIIHRMEEAKLGNPARSWQDNCKRFPDIAKFTPYRYIGKVENALIFEDEKNGIEHHEDGGNSVEHHEDGSCSTDDEVQGKEPPSTGLLESIQRRVIDPFKAAITRPKGERVKSRSEIIKRTLDSVETGIKDRQRKMADELLRWRDAQIGDWEGELRWGPPAPANALAHLTARPCTR